MYLLVRESLVVGQVYRSCVMTNLWYDTWIDLIVLDRFDFNVILGMNWFYSYHVILGCFSKTVTLCIPSIPFFT